jgi:YVTN family beta-propeller protein
MRRRWGTMTLMFAVSAAALVATGVAQEKKTPKPALVVLSKGASELEIVDPGTLKIVGKAGVGTMPHEVAVSDDGKFALVTNYGPHMDGTTLSVVDLNTMKEVHRVNLTNLKGPAGEDFGSLTGPHGVEFFAGEFYFTAEGAKKIARYDVAKNRVDWEHEIGQNRTHMLLIAPDGKTIYTANVNSASVTVATTVDGKTWTNTVIAVGKGPEGNDLSPDGKEFWAANSGDGTVSIIDTAIKKVVATIDVGTKHSNRVKFTPDGKLVLISDIGSGELVVVDAGTRKVVKRLKLGSSAEGILIRPDGAVAYVAVSGDDKVDVVDLKKLEVVASIQTGKDPDGMAWRK